MSNIVIKSVLVFTDDTFPPPNFSKCHSEALIQCTIRCEPNKGIHSGLKEDLV